MIFYVIWASPPCTEYSKAKTRGVRNLKDANSVVLKTLDIIKYLNPKYYIIENPQTGLLKNQTFMCDIPFEDIDYCKYDMPYRKRTRLWNNVTHWKPIPLCKKDCNSICNGKHIGSCGNGRRIYTDKSYTQLEQYKIPHNLTREMFIAME